MKGFITTIASVFLAASPAQAQQPFDLGNPQALQSPFGNSRMGSPS